jgi:hypothetical protein
LPGLLDDKIETSTKLADSSRDGFMNLVTVGAELSSKAHGLLPKTALAVHAVSNVGVNNWNLNLLFGRFLIRSYLGRNRQQVRVANMDKASYFGII